MSQPAPNQTQSFTRILLIGMIIFLGYQLFVMPLQRGPSKTRPELLKELQTANLEIKDLTARRVTGEYEKAINADSSLNQAAKDRLYLEAHVLLADVQRKAGTQRKDLARVIPAADTMVALQRKFSASPIWQEKFTLPGHKDFPETSASAAEMKEIVRTVSSTLGRETPVWGMFPGYEVIDALVKMTGSNPGISYALCCLLLAIAVRTIIFPLSHRQMMWGRKMSQLTPLMNELREKYKPKDGKPLSMEKQQQQQQDMMRLYQEYGINPAAGCAPALLQMPLFLFVYQAMLHYRFEFEKGTFLWINSDIGRATNGFLGANLGQKDYLLIFIYAVSMVVTTLLTPVSDPTNAKQSRMIGIGISVFFGIVMFFWPVPSAFVLYWTFTNILATAQSLWAYRLPLPPLEKKNTPTGGIFAKAMEAQRGNTTPTVEAPRKTGVPQRHQPKKKKK